MQEKARYDFLDWLRVIAIFVLLFFHTGMLFVGWGWHIQNAETISTLALPMDIAHRLRMPLLFVIAGAGMWFALNRRSGSRLVAERSVRLLVPLIVGMFLIVPPQVYFERIFRGQWDGGYVSFLFERVFEFHPYPHGDFSWHHLWFIAYLYVYALLLLPFMLWWKRHPPRLRPGMWIFALGIPLSVNESILRPLFPETHNLVADWYLFVHYLLFTTYGFVLASLPGAWDWLSGQRRRSLIAAVGLLAPALVLYEHGVISRDGALDSFVANIFTWLCLMAFLGYGRRYLSFENGLLRWARDASYPIYILHQTVIIAIGYFVIQQPWSPWSKYWIVLVGTLVCCVVLYELCVRRLSVTRLIFGMKARTRPGLPFGRGEVAPTDRQPTGVSRRRIHAPPPTLWSPPPMFLSAIVKAHSDGLAEHTDLADLAVEIEDSAEKSATDRTADAADAAAAAREKRLIELPAIHRARWL
jgi:peptidoglycan/LPS O-acetylase OafA/YrhL